MRLREVNKKINLIASDCLRVFKMYCEKSNELTISSIPDNDYIYQLKGSLESEALSYREIVKVANFFDNYWITFALYFGINKISPKHYSYYINNIYIKVYHGLKADINKALLFRAEWSSNDTGPFEHAEPHWHFHPQEILLLTKPDNFDSYMKLKEEEKDLLDVVGQTKNFDYDISKIHFSMSNEWHNGKSKSHLIKPDENNLTKWLDGLLNHIKNQLMYCSEKLHI